MNMKLYLVKKLTMRDRVKLAFLYSLFNNKQNPA